MAYSIRADRDGYRRGGMAHSTTPEVHPDDIFTPEQLAQLQADPRILIQEVPDAALAPEDDETESADTPSSSSLKAAAKTGIAKGK